MVINTIKKGYKQTEIGVIPDDWDTDQFINIVDKYIDYRGRTPKKIGMEWGKGNILALSANNVQMGKIDCSKEAYFGSDELYKKWMVQGTCEKDDVLLTMEAPLGNVAQIPDNKKYILSQRVILIKPKGLTKNFLAKLLAGSHFQKELLNNATGTTAQGIQRHKLDKIEICFPKSVKEQNAIANVLTDIDSLIEKLEKLIEKKKMIKQGAMQELLTGRRRLPGFSDKWKMRKLGEITETGSGGTPLTSVSEYYGGDISWVSITDMTNVRKYLFNTERYLTNKGFTNSAAKMFPKGTVLYAMYASLGECCIATKAVCTSQAILGIRPKKILNNQFLYYYLTFIKERVKTMGQQGTQSNLNSGMVKSFEILLPQIEEQILIITILSDMDLGIERLEDHLDKYHAIKQGTMQALLTGKIRLLTK